MSDPEVDRYRLVIQSRASRDIVAICSYIERQSPQNASIVATGLIGAIDSLVLLPHRYEVYLSHQDQGKVVHSMAVPPFIVYYRVLERDKVVNILTVRHGARRQPRRF